MQSKQELALHTLGSHCAACTSRHTRSCRSSAATSAAAARLTHSDAQPLIRRPSGHQAAMSGLDKVFKEISVKKLYKDLMMLARFMGQRQGNEATLVGQVQEQFRMNMHETDEAKIRQHKESALRVLSNVYFQEAERLARKKR